MADTILLRVECGYCGQHFEMAQGLAPLQEHPDLSRLPASQRCRGSGLLGHSVDRVSTCISVHLEQALHASKHSLQMLDSPQPDCSLDTLQDLIGEALRHVEAAHAVVSEWSDSPDAIDCGRPTT